MSLQLSLIPIDHDTPTWGYGHQIIAAHHGHDIYEQIYKLPLTPIPDSFYTFRAPNHETGNPGYGDTQMTPYGEKMMATTMGSLKQVGLTGPAGAFVQASPDTQRVALFWH
jgi:hypothetical protein